jgi:Tol biopolymer transport system component
LIYRKSINDQQSLVIVDADGKGRKIQPLPDGAVVKSLANAISPDGKWLAFYTGSDGRDPYDLALNLMDLSSGQTQLLVPLLSADHPDNFRQAADTLAQQGITLVEGINQSVIPQFLRDAFLRGIDSLAWSPDGRYLAFAGQMDGLSSDLYVYDIESRTVERLSDGPEQIQSIT